MSTRALLAAVAALAAILPLAAQTPEDALSAVRARPEPGDQDRAQIQAFVAQQVAAIAGNDPLAAQQAAAALRAAYAGPDAFKRAYAAACLDAVAAAYKQADVVPATRLLAVLNSFGVLDTHALLLEALRDPRVGVRAAAAIGLARLRPQIAAAGADLYGRTLEALRSAGEAEKSRDTLRAIYRALDYAALPSPPDPKRTAAAVLALLEARARLYAAGEVPALGADDLGLRLAGTLAAALDEAERKRLTSVVATMMKHAIEQYASGSRKLADVRERGSNQQLVERRDAMERVILVGEELLRTLLAVSESPPDVVAGMRKLDTTAMKNEWVKWVGRLRQAVGSDFSLVELPAAEPQPGAGAPKPAGPR